MKVHCCTFTTTLTFTKLATYYASVAKSNFGILGYKSGGINPFIPLGYALDR